MGGSKFAQGSSGRVLCAPSSSPGAGLMYPHWVLSASTAVPLLLPVKGSLGKGSCAGIIAGDGKAGPQEELISDQESKEVELVLQGDCCFWPTALVGMGP